MSLKKVFVFEYFFSTTKIKLSCMKWELINIMNQRADFEAHNSTEMQTCSSVCMLKLSYDFKGERHERTKGRGTNTESVACIKPCQKEERVGWGVGGASRPQGCLVSSVSCFLLFFKVILLLAKVQSLFQTLLRAVVTVL